MSEHLPAEYAGRFRDGYDSGDINQVLDRVEDLTGIELLCVWAYFDDLGYGGDSQLFVVDSSAVHEIAGDLWPWLLDGKQEAPDGPGDPMSWQGASAGFDTVSLIGDGRHNAALEAR